jgi:trimethylamine--corrinoid protein Co-methyltransferase
MEYGQTSSMELLVITDEIIRMTKFYMLGVSVNENTLALDAIDRVEPGAGFLADDHTMQNFRTGQWLPDLIDRKRYEAWEKSGAKDMFARANERARKILAEHEVPPLPEEAESVFADVLAERRSQRH